MKSNMIATLAATLAMLSAVSAEAEVQTYAGSGCSGTAAQMPIDGCVVVSNVGSAKQNKGEDGIHYTCNAYSDTACNTKVGEVYDCTSGAIGSISCYSNPPL